MKKYLCGSTVVVVCVCLAVSGLDAQVPQLVKDIKPGIDSSFATFLLNVNGTLFFRASDNGGDEELWKSDGSEAGTVRVKDIFPGPSSSSANDFTGIDGVLFFSANDGANGGEMWKSDGTEAGTVMVKDINPAPLSGSLVSEFTNVAGTIFFRANDGSNGRELWKSDGTDAGTVMVKDISPGGGSGLTNTDTIGAVGSIAFFSAEEPGFGRELWKSDGTNAGTVMVKDIRLGGGSVPADLIDLNGTLLFSALETSTGRELWKSDGTNAGTVIVKDINPNASAFVGIGNGEFTKVNGIVIFAARDGVNGQELWKTDGTAAGTELVKDIRQGGGDSSPSDLVNVNGTVFFRADDGVSGFELWKSDGTEAGTELVKDVRLGISASFPTFLTNVNGILYFSAHDGTTGTELWKSNGTEAGTVLVSDIHPEPTGPVVRDIAAVNGGVYFSADDGIAGREVWTLSSSYDVWISSDQSGSPFSPSHDCVRFIGNSMSTDLCGDSGTVARFPLLSVLGLELWIAQVPCQGLNLLYIGTAFSGEALPLGGNAIAASVIGLALGNTLGVEGFENAACTAPVSSSNPYAAGTVQGNNPGPEWDNLLSPGNQQGPLGRPGEAQTVANKTYEVWASQASDPAPFFPGRDCLRFTATTMTSDACGDTGAFVEFPLFSTPGLSLWIGQVPCSGANLVYFGTSYDGAVLPLGGNVVSASVVGLTQGSTIALEGFENAACVP